MVFTGQSVAVYLPRSVAVPDEGAYLGVVNEPVDYWCGDGLFTKHFSPLPKRNGRGENRGRVFISTEDELKERVCGVWFEG